MSAGVRCSLREKNFPDALVAVGRGPVEGDGVGIAVGGDAGVGGGKDSVGRIEGLGELYEGDVAGPVIVAGDGVDGNGAEWAGVEVPERRSQAWKRTEWWKALPVVAEVALQRAVCRRRHLRTCG